jgi:hypothetical protein
MPRAHASAPERVWERLAGTTAAEIAVVCVQQVSSVSLERARAAAPPIVWARTAAVTAAVERAGSAYLTRPAARTGFAWLAVRRTVLENSAAMMAAASPAEHARATKHAI